MGSPSSEATSSATTAYTAIREWILTGEIEPGSHVVVRPIAERLGLSPTPVKIALSALEKSGLLEVVVNAGYFLPQRDRDTFVQAVQLLTEFDVIAARAVMARSDVDLVLDVLDSIVNGQIEKTQRNDFATGFDMEFHETLWQHSSNTVLAETANHIRGRAMVSSGQVMRQPTVVSHLHVEHAEIVAALRTGETRRIEAAIRSHNQATAELVLALWDEPASAPQGRKNPTLEGIS